MDLITQLFGKSMVSITATDTGEAVLSGLAISKIYIRMASEPQRHQLESGECEFDTRTIKSTRVMLDVIVKSIVDMEAFAAHVQNRTDLFTVTIRGLTFANMKVAPVYMAQNKQNTSSTPVRLEYQQLLIEDVQSVTFASVSDSSLVDRGIALANNALSSVQEMASKVQRVAERVIS